MRDNAKNKGRTLQQSLLGFIVILLTLLISGSFLLNISVTRESLQNQLHSHTQDAATSLGLSLSASIDAGDKVAAGRMVDAIFDSGDYLKIVYFDLNGSPLVIRQERLTISGVPDWFISSISLVSPSKSAQVVSGWSQLGSIVVQSHPGYAYIELWEIIQKQLLWFAIIAFGSFIIVRRLLLGVLRPLNDLEQHAIQMGERRFNTLVPIPNTRELAGVARAMNSMTEQLGKMFQEQLELIEGLRSQSFLDDLTGLSNREGFDGRLRAEYDSQESIFQGSLILLQINEFSEINNNQGREFGDQLLTSISEILVTVTRKFPSSFAARRSGPDFSLFLPRVLSEDIDALVKGIMVDLSSLPKIKQLLRDDSIHMGVACVRELDTGISLFSKADMALRKAQSKTVSGWQRYANIDAPDGSLNEVRQANEWRTIIQQVLAERSVILYIQPVFNAEKELLYNHMLSRIELNGELVVAGLFLPMAERFNLMVPFDQLVVEKVIASLSLADGLTEGGRYCITLSEESVADHSFIEWFSGKLRALPHLASMLMIEVSEHIVSFNEQALINLSKLAQEHDFHLSIERFGVSSVPFSYLQYIHIDTIKVDHSFIRKIQDNQSNQFFLRSAVQIAHGQSIKVIAVGVESEEEWNALNLLGLDGAMGYYLQRPEKSSTFDVDLS